MPALIRARGFDLVAQRREPDRAYHDIAADHVARRAVEAERLGQLHAFGDRRRDLVAFEILLEARHVETDLLGDGERSRLVGLAASAEQLLVEFEVFLAALVLHP